MKDLPYWKSFSTDFYFIFVFVMQIGPGELRLSYRLRYTCFIKVDKSRSSLLPVTSGVAVTQGSVLGLLLFTWNVNDICTVAPTRVTIKLFADATKLYTVFISEWCDHWQPELSPSKCSIMHVVSARQRSINSNFDYHIGQTSLPDLQTLVIYYCVTYNNKT